jgi:hypothetical protein
VTSQEAARRHAWNLLCNKSADWRPGTVCPENCGMLGYKIPIVHLKVRRARRDFYFVPAVRNSALLHLERQAIFPTFFAETDPRRRGAELTPSFLCSPPQKRAGAASEVHRGYSLAVVAQKSQPTFSRLWAPGCSPHPAGDAGFRYLEAEHEKFAVDAGRTPSRILRDHLEDQLTNLL